jgi:hypothetical protein
MPSSLAFRPFLNTTINDGDFTVAAELDNQVKEFSASGIFTIEQLPVKLDRNSKRKFQKSEKF